MGKPISFGLRSQIVKHKANGKTCREISEMIGCSPSTVSRLTRECHSVPTSKRIGRPRVFDRLNERYVRNLASSGKCSTAVEIRYDLRDTCGISASTNTILRTLRRHGYKSRTKSKRAKLQKVDMRKRRDFVATYKSWEPNDFDKVIWSDETRIRLSGSDGRERCFRRDGQVLKDHHVNPVSKSGHDSIHVWGCFLANGIGYLCRIHGNMDAATYKAVLENELMDTVKWYKLKRKDILFQQDNASSHTAKDIQKWFRSKKVRVMEWPPRSPDLNSIENLWDALKRKVRELPPAKDLDELWDRVQDAWNAITPEQCQKLVHSLPKRIAQVSQARGGYTRY